MIDINFYPVVIWIYDRRSNGKIIRKIKSNEKNIIIVHTGISHDGNTLPGCISKQTLDLFKDKVIYIAGGHIHSFATYPKEKPYFFVSGSLEF